MAAYINPANQAPGLQTGPPQGVMFILSYIAEEPFKNLLAWNHEAKSLQIKYIVIFSGPQHKSMPPGVQIGHTLWVVSSHRLIMGKT